MWQEITQPIHLYIVMTAVCLWVWLARRRTTLAWWAFVTMMLGWNLALVLKYVVQRARPVVDDPVSHSPGYSFPSGHAANAAIVATVVVVCRKYVGDRLSGVLAVGLDGNPLAEGADAPLE